MVNKKRIVKWHNHLLRFVVCVIIGLLFISCSEKSNKQEFSNDCSDNSPPFLEAPLGAVDTQYSKMKNMDGYILFFIINDTYPASKTLDFISKKVDLAGFKKLKYDLLNPEAPSGFARGWSKQVRSEKSLFGNKSDVFHLWHADWINEKEEIATVGLAYIYPEKGPKDINTLRVTIYYYKSVNWIAKAVEKYKEKHPEVKFLFHDILPGARLK